MYGAGGIRGVLREARNGIDTRTGSRQRGYDELTPMDHFQDLSLMPHEQSKSSILSSV
jgi:hypothetical protein